MVFIEWDMSFSVGVKFIDDQHKKLFALINALYDAKESAANKDFIFIDGVIQDLLAYVDFHFKTEEKYFKEFHYEKEKKHIKQHKFYEDKIKAFHEKYLRERNEKEISGEIMDFLKNWISNHIKISDKEYQKCFNERGLI